MAEASWKEIVEGPRWARFTSALKDECFTLGLKIVHLDVEKRFLRETVRFEVTGEEHKLAILKRAVYETIDEYNARGKRA